MKRNSVMGIFNFSFGDDPDQIREYLDKNAVILDVRTTHEYDNFHFENAVHIPLSKLRNKIKEIQALKRPIIAHCKVGARSEKAKKILKANGVDTINGGGIKAMKKVLKQY